MCSFEEFPTIESTPGGSPLYKKLPLSHKKGSMRAEQKGSKCEGYITAKENVAPKSWGKGEMGRELCIWLQSLKVGELQEC